MIAALTGLGSGALHALSGPDHLVSLAPLSVGRRRGGWIVGLTWGFGHGVGTLLLGVLLLVLARGAHLEHAAVWAERAAGAALIAMGLHGLAALRRRTISPAGLRLPWKAVAGIGFVHGGTGAAALLLLLPAAASASPSTQGIYLAGFTVGSTLAMAGLTAALALASRAPACAALVRRAPRAAATAAVLLGVAWIATA